MGNSSVLPAMMLDMVQSDSFRMDVDVCLRRLLRYLMTSQSTAY